MKFFKKLMITAIIFIFVFTLTDIPSISNPAITQAATIKITKKTLSLEVGKTATLQITGTKKTVKWSTSDKTIASVSSKGKVTAVAIGKAKITGTVSGKKYTCSVTVTRPANPYLANAPFEAQEVPIGNIDFVVPADWTLTYNLTDSGISAALKPNDTTNLSSIMIGIIPMEDGFDYDQLKEKFAPMYTVDYLESVYAKQLGDLPFEITDYSQSDITVTSGNALKTEYSLTMYGVSLVQQLYDFNIQNYLVEVESLNTNGTDLSSIIEYMINSIIITE